MASPIAALLHYILEPRTSRYFCDGGLRKPPNNLHDLNYILYATSTRAFRKQVLSWVYEIRDGRYVIPFVLLILSTFEV